RRGPWQFPSVSGTTKNLGMRPERPISLSLARLRWPVTAIASIAHRISGILLFLGFAYLLYLLDLALSSETGFAEAGGLLAMTLPKLALWGVLVLLAYHLLAGIKHLLLDLHVGDGFAAAKRASWLVFAATGAAAALLGAWLW
ncbi:MAG: succinate dehydrogenase, cytochrome b556 subunit, partial [Gammaproteobacteria bacterium]|nr:succinate dehydrogenase, cytochrome b556 subunit [Gammaproteobacteria bacterium]MYE86327.1 succinate dehydrogenase, cytochrome b556 subunit [Gammaproteobacteria bacterium]MYK27454.1 succinate dehydrogenase, cytochrome b556 subunit [Gammaproteobacteria bacterium]